MAQKNRKYFENKINSLEKKMNDAQCELLGIGQELIAAVHKEDNYEPIISTDNDGLIFIKKDDCNDPFISNEFSSKDILDDLKIQKIKLLKKWIKDNNRNDDLYDSISIREYEVDNF